MIIGGAENFSESHISELRK